MSGWLGRISRWVTVCFAVGLLATSVQAADVAPKRVMELQILSDGRVILDGQIIVSPDDLEAKLRVLKEQGPPLELHLKSLKDVTYGVIASVLTVLQSIGGLNLGFIGNLGEPREAPKPAPIEPDGTTI